MRLLCIKILHKHKIYCSNIQLHLVHTCLVLTPLTSTYICIDISAGFRIYAMVSCARTLTIRSAILYIYIMHCDLLHVTRWKRENFAIIWCGGNGNSSLCIFFIHFHFTSWYVDVDDVGDLRTVNIEGTICSSTMSNSVHTLGVYFLISF